MADLTTFRGEVAAVVSGLARAVVAELFAAAEQLSPDKQNKQSPGAEEKLRVLVDSLCFEAVEKILKMVQKRDETPGGWRDPRDPRDPRDHQDPCGGSSEGSVKTNTAEAELHREGEEGGARRPRTEHAYFLVYGSAAVDSGRLMMSLQGGANTGNDTSSSSCSPPRQADDHEYARPPSPPPGAATKRGVGVRKQPRGQRKKHGGSAETLLQCSRCDMLFPNAERLADHEKKSHPACSVCGTAFSGVLKLREHEMKEHGLLPYACDYCTKTFNHEAHRDLHVKARHTGEKTCHCDVCGKGYSCVSVLKTHRMTHFDKTFICDVCGKGFYHACHLTRHKLVHQDVRPHRCPTCGRGFTQAANLRSHQATHGGERQLCSVCGKSFRCLKNHVISKHSHELPADELPAADAVVGCDICGKKFPNPSQHRLHLRSHTGEKPFHCDVCGKSYRLKEMLRDHRYTHSGEKPYRCSLCAKTFNLAASFMRHRSIHTGETPYSCSDCGKHFRLLTFLKAHLQTKAHLKRAEQRQDAAAL